MLSRADGNTGFTDDIGCQPGDFNLAVSLFYLTFVLFQPISAGVGGWVGPKRWIPFIMVSCLLIMISPKLKLIHCAACMGSGHVQSGVHLGPG